MLKTIYHGTNTKYLSKILKYGISPRGANGKTNWEKAPSHPDMVYMSTAYPFYFSYFSKAEQKETEKAVVLEIDFSKLNKDLLFPDEDFIWHCLPEDGRPELGEIRENIGYYKRYWRISLSGLGNVCYKGIIKKEWIKRYYVVDFSQRAVLAMRVLDPSISLLNYRFCGKDYKNIVKWFFGDRKYLPEVYQNKRLLPEKPEEALSFVKEKIQFWTKESLDRTGIEVFDLKNVKHAV